MFLLCIFMLLISNQTHIGANQTEKTTQTQGGMQSNVQINDNSRPGQQQPPAPHPQQPYFVINLNQTNSNNNDQANSQSNLNSNSSSQSNMNAHTNQTLIVNEIKKTILNFFDFVKKEFPKQKQVALNLFQQHTKLIVIGTIAFSYCLLFAYINLLSNFLAHKDGWHCWKQGISIEELAMLNQIDLAQTLCIEIQQRYFNPDKPGNSMKAFTCFYKEVEKELQKIDRYIQIGKFINTCQIDYFFSVSKKKVKRAIEKKRRLEFMQKILITYMSAQNMMPAAANVRSYKFEKVIQIIKNSLVQSEKKAFSEEKTYNA